MKQKQENSLNKKNESILNLISACCLSLTTFSAFYAKPQLTYVLSLSALPSIWFHNQIYLSELVYLSTSGLLQIIGCFSNDQGAKKPLKITQSKLIMFSWLITIYNALIKVDKRLGAFNQSTLLPSSKTNTLHLNIHLVYSAIWTLTSLQNKKKVSRPIVSSSLIKNFSIFTFSFMWTSVQNRFLKLEFPTAEKVRHALPWLVHQLFFVIVPKTVFFQCLLQPYLENKLKNKFYAALVTGLASGVIEQHEHTGKSALSCWANVGFAWVGYDAGLKSSALSRLLHEFSWHALGGYPSEQVSYGQQ